MKEFNGTLEKFIDMGLNRPGIVFQFEVEHWETTFLAKGEVRYVKTPSTYYWYLIGSDNDCDLFEDKTLITKYFDLFAYLFNQKEETKQEIKSIINRITMSKEERRFNEISNKKSQA